MHPKKKGSVWLYFSQQPTLLIVHRGLKESITEAFPLSREIIQIIFFLLLKLEGTLRWKLQIVHQMQLICFWEMKHQFPPRIYWIEWLWCWIYFSVFIYFWHLNWGDESVLHSSISVLKSCLFFSVLTSWMSASILFRSCLAHLIVNLLALIIFFLSFKEMQISLLIKSKRCI